MLKLYRILKWRFITPSYDFYWFFGSCPFEGTMVWYWSPVHCILAECVLLLCFDRVWPSCLLQAVGSFIRYTSQSQRPVDFYRKGIPTFKRLMNHFDAQHYLGGIFAQYTRQIDLLLNLSGDRKYWTTLIVEYLINAVFFNGNRLNYRQENAEAL